MWCDATQLESARENLLTRLGGGVCYRCESIASQSYLYCLLLPLSEHADNDIQVYLYYYVVEWLHGGLILIEGHSGMPSHDSCRVLNAIVFSAP